MRSRPPHTCGRVRVGVKDGGDEIDGEGDDGDHGGGGHGSGGHEGGSRGTNTYLILPTLPCFPVREAGVGIAGSPNYGPPVATNLAARSALHMHESSILIALALQGPIVTVAGASAVKAEPIDDLSTRARRSYQNRHTECGQDDKAIDGHMHE